MVQKITDKIDLTLDALFASDEDFTKNTRKWQSRRFFSQDFFMAAKTFFILLFDNGFHTIRFFYKKETDYYSSYKRIFKTDHECTFDDSLGWGDPSFCGRCGASINLLTDYLGVCHQCNIELNYQEVTL